MNKIKRALGIWKSFGFKVFFLRSISRFYQSFYYLKKDLGSTPEMDEFKYCFFIDEEKLEELISQEKDFLSQQKIQILRERLKRPTTKGIVYEKNGQIYGMHWVNTERFVEFQSFDEPLPKKSIYLYDTLVFPEYRRQGVSSILYYFTFYAFKENYKVALTFVTTYNQPMLLQMEKLNCKKIGIYRNNKIMKREELKEYDDEKQI